MNQSALQKRLVSAGRRLLNRSPRLTNAAVQGLGRFQSLRDRGLSPSARWTRRSGDEVSWWTAALEADGARERFADRLDPDSPIRSPSLRKALEQITAERVRILDVGSGPLTSVGHRFPGKEIEVVAVDPLAEEYVRVLRERDIDPPVFPLACFGEEIAERFESGAFDVAFAQNSLDHSADPIGVLKNMLSVLKPDGCVALAHMPNEGERNGYFGSHFWNIECRNGRFILWNRSETRDVGAELGDGYLTECWPAGNDWVHCLIWPHRVSDADNDPRLG